MPKEVQIDPKVGTGKAGIDVKGREVSKVMSSGQSEKAGVKVGWKVLKVAGADMPDDNKAILAALKKAKEAGKKFKVLFDDGTKAAAAKPGAKPAAEAKPAAGKGEAAAAKAAEEAKAAEVGAKLAAEAAAACAAADAARAAAEAAEAERKQKGNGALTLKYSTYTEEFTIVDGGLLAAEIDARFCLSFVMPGCAVHVSEMSVSECTADRQLPPEEQMFCYLPETEGIKGIIEVDDEENFGQKIKQEVVSTRIDELQKDRVYHVHVTQDAEQEAKDKERTRLKYAAAAAEQAKAALDKGPRPESCSCIEGNPCVDKYNCLDWNNRFEIAGRHGWKLDPLHANKCAM